MLLRIDLDLAQAVIDQRRGNIEAADVILRRALETIAGIPSNPRRDWTEQCLLYSHAMGLPQDRLPEAIDQLERVVQGARRLGEPDLALGASALVLRLRISDGSATAEDARGTVEAAREAMETRIEAHALETLGILLQEGRRFAEAEACFDEEIELARLTGHLEAEGSAVLRLAVLHLEAMQWRRAVGSADEALRLFPTDNPLAERALALKALATHLGGDPEGALRHLPDDPRTETTGDIVAMFHRIGARVPAPEPTGLKGPQLRALGRLEAQIAGSTDVDPDGRWFMAPTGRVDLEDRPVLVRLLSALVRGGGQTVSTAQLVGAGWPGEQLVGDSGARRVRSAVWMLRKLGLRDRLKTTSGGYALAPEGAPSAQ